MLIIRFQPVGRKHKRLYRVVAAQKARSVNKKFIEKLGWYNPYTKEAGLDAEKIKTYIERNTELSSSVRSLFVKQGIIK